MYLFLYGPPGTGKTTIGQRLAEDLHLPFLDLDRLIESQSAQSIPQIMAEQGEAAFRDMETAMLKTLTASPRREDWPKEAVIALGGGALLRKENRALAEASGTIILLMAERETLFQRLKADSLKRPLLAGDLHQQLTSLLESRKEHYTSFPLQLNVDGKSAEQISRQIQVLAGRYHLSAMGEYDVLVAPISNLPPLPYSLLVTDENVAKHHLDKFKDIHSIVLPAGEEHKNLQTISRLWQAFLENSLDRHSTVIALGGGVISDLVGFAASTYMRGIDWLALPTTLLAMADASLGGKTGIDLPQGKNLIGSFHPPKLVLADPSLLLTLNDRELRCGLAEVVKHGIIGDPELFHMCSLGLNEVKANLETIVKRAMAVKIQIIEQDPYEKGLRSTLNVGHTVGHAVELVSGFKLRHGEAIAIGMVVEARYAERSGIAQAGVADAIAQTLSSLGLPVEIPEELPREAILRAMQVDKKKKAQSIRFALPLEIGKVELVDVLNLEEVIGK